MLKLILLSIYGHKKLSTRVLFNSIKSYLVFYMMLLPAFMNGRDLSSSKEMVTPDEEYRYILEYAAGTPGNVFPSRDLPGDFLRCR